MYKIECRIAQRLGRRPLAQLQVHFLGQVVREILAMRAVVEEGAQRLPVTGISLFHLEFHDVATVHACMVIGEGHFAPLGAKK